MKTCLCIAFLFFALDCSAQYFDKVLAIDPVHGSKRERLRLGDPLKVKCKDGTILNGTLDYLGDSTIIVADDQVKISEIKRVVLVDKRQGWQLLSAVALRAGIGYFGITTFNGLINDDSPAVTEQNIRISGTFIVIGVAAALLNQKKMRIKDENHIKIIDLSPVPIEKSANTVEIQK